MSRPYESSARDADWGFRSPACRAPAVERDVIAVLDVDARPRSHLALPVWQNLRMLNVSTTSCQGGESREDLL